MTTRNISRFLVPRNRPGQVGCSSHPSLGMTRLRRGYGAASKTWQGKPAATKAHAERPQNSAPFLNLRCRSSAGGEALRYTSRIPGFAEAAKDGAPENAKARSSSYKLRRRSAEERQRLRADEIDRPLQRRAPLGYARLG